MWTAFLVETTTGRKLHQLPLRAGAGAWDRPVNDAWTHSVGVPTRELMRLPETAWAPHAACVLLCLHGEPFQLGPILDEPSGNRQNALLSCGGAQHLVHARMALGQDFGPGEHEALAAYSLQLSGESLGTLGWRILQAAQVRPGGSLPIVQGTPSQAADRTREYQGWNLGNNDASNRLKQITEVIGGPNVAFPVRWADDRRDRVEWSYECGTEGHVWVPQADTATLDLTAPQSPATAVGAVASYDYVNRVYGVGAGQDEGTLIRILDDPVIRGPWREIVFADSQIDNPDLLEEKMRAFLGAHRIYQLSAETPVFNRMPFPGQRMRVRWPEGYLRVPAGEYLPAIIKQSGSLESGIVKWEFQEWRHEIS